ncbi:aminodeoxychorismate synthase component I [Thiomicrorhabdus sp.]|uniref:aminodeoxychorismate synthase component I n=1 Tax=Thiomicrorhabdus sp. TaxID=2039724 RepID=UPI0029C72929|nr:aminodeoxychorismate synthase component I [Thiomicrorhabdus sp.]
MPTKDAHNVISRCVPLASGQTVDLSLFHRLNPERYPVLLESVAKGQLGRYDILMAFPQETLRLDSPQGQQAFIDQVQSALAENAVDGSSFEQSLPFSGGWFAYFSYDYAQVVEPVLKLPENQFPLALLTRIPAAFIYDHQEAALFLLAESDFETCLDTMQADLVTVLKSAEGPVQYSCAENLCEEEDAKFLQGVESIKDYILSGDVFQVNLSREWNFSLPSSADAVDLYDALRENNPAPFACLARLSLGDGEPWHIISSSPERLVKYRSPWVETRPIAGTRRRSADPDADKALIDELIAHPKERAEHIMLIDLERNDLGRICQPGTVEVNELMVIESYEHVHHIVSNVRGKLQEHLSPLDIIHALFPGGTITGCPKVRCMEIIAELEQMPREAYTGSLGYINRDGSMDLNILIRTMMHYPREHHAEVRLRAGAGIVADSLAENELTETRHKAKGLLKALQVI